MRNSITCKFCDKEFIPKAHNTIYCSYECRCKGRLLKEKKYRLEHPKEIKRTWSDAQLIESIKNNFTMSGVLRDLGLGIFGCNHTTIKNRIKQLNLDISHFTGRGHRVGKTHTWAKDFKPEEVFTEHSIYKGTGNNLKRKLFKYKLLENKCHNCGLTKWLNKKISLDLHHINGIKDDNRLENLTLLCPNCHALTKNYCGKNKNKI